MVQPSPSNLDDQQLPQEIGVCQELSTGSSNEGTMQGASAGRDSNQIDGNNNHITQIENQTVYIVPNEGKGQHTISLPPKNSIPGKASRLLYGHILSWASLMLVSSLSGTVITAPPDRSLLGKEKPHLVSCNNQSLAEKPETLRIAIADFARSNEIPSSNRQMEKFLLRQLPHGIPMKLENQVIVCRLPQEFDNSKAAKEAGKSFDAAVVIWGSITTSEGFLGGVEVTKSDEVFIPLLPSVTLEELQTPTFKDQEMLHIVDFLTKLALSKIYYIDNNLVDARSILKQALEEANHAGKISKKIHNYLAESYLYLGTMYENQAPECIDRLNCKKAIEAYQKAIELDNTKSNYFIFLNIGGIYDSLKEPEKARAAYSKLIEPVSLYVIDALKNRAILSAKSNPEAAEADFEQLILLDPKVGYTSRAQAHFEFWNDVQGAINDSQLLLKEEPNNSNNYHLLGLYQLQAGSIGIAEAKQTYHKLRCYLTDNNKTRDSIIRDLNNLAEKQPQLQPEIANIIAFIQVDKTSSETTCN